jgi:GGDEF domain-containing protein
MMQNTPLKIQVTDSLAKVSQLATKRPLDQVYCPLIVCDGETYMGTLSIQELLKSITKIQLEHALHCNPLSRLPGNIGIESDVQARLQANVPFVLLHFDLDNFKAFNDFYGYERGDKMILLVAEMLRETVLSNDFVGHVGGDDFVMLMEGQDWESRIWQMLDSFSVKSAMLYDETERDQKCIETTDRAGDIKKFDLASLSVSALPCPPGQFSSHLEASEVIAEIKHRSKQIRGNSLVVNRREMLN